MARLDIGIVFLIYKNNPQTLKLIFKIELFFHFSVAALHKYLKKETFSSISENPVI
jgi:hypothetical protein